MKNIQLEDLNSLVSPEMSKARGNRTGFNVMIVHFYIYSKLDIIRYDT